MKQVNQQVARWKGSQRTAMSVRKQIAERWGEEEARNYDPLTNCLTFKTWMSKGYLVKKGEKVLRSITYIEGTNEISSNEEKDSEKSYLYPKTVCLFYIKQVEKVVDGQEKT